MSTTIESIFKRIFEKIESMPVSELDARLLKNQDCDGLTVEEFLQDFIIPQSMPVHHVITPELARYSGQYRADDEAADSSFGLCASDLVECAA